MRGLPWATTEQQVRAFFSGLAVSAVHITLARDGRPSGECFAVFEHEDDTKAALAKDKEKFLASERWVECFPATKGELYSVQNSTGAGTAAVVGDAPAPLDLRDADVWRVLKMRGLPFEASKGDVIAFFEEFALSAADVYLVRRADGKPSGEGFAIFASVEQAQLALAKDHDMIGDRYIELRATTKTELWHRVGPAVAAVSREDSQYSGVLRMRGLPWATTMHEVCAAHVPISLGRAPWPSTPWS